MAGLLQVKTAQQLENEKQTAQQQVENEKQAQVVDNLASHVRSCWSVAKTHRSRYYGRLTKCLRLKKGEYDSDKLAKIKSVGGSEIYMNLVGTKCRAAKSWLSDLYAGSGDKPFVIEPTPTPELDPAIQQEMIALALQTAMQTGLPQQNIEALLQKHEERLKDEMLQEGEKRMERMSEHIMDMLIEGGFRAQFDAFLDDLVTFPYAIFKAPVYRRKKKIKWKEQQGGSFAPETEYVVQRIFQRVSPFNFYPSPSMTNIGDSWHIEHIQYSYQDLANMRQSKGYSASNISKVLAEFRQGGLREWAFETGERERLEGKTSTMQGEYDYIDAIAYTGTIQGKQLLEWGIEQQVDDPFEEYPVTIEVIGGYTIRALINPDPTGRSNYYKASFRDIAGSFMGEALPEVLEDIQEAANNAARSLMNNMAIGSQPQVAVDIANQPPGTKITSIKPGKVWTYNSRTGANGAGVSFFAPEIKSQELLNVYERFERYADEKSGIPAYAYGSDNAAGAGKTASGLSMLMNAASKTIKAIVRSIDINVIEPMVSSLYQSAMLDPAIPNEAKGDAQVKARGSDALMHKEATAMHQLELLGMLNNPTDMQIIGLEGRRELLNEVMKSSDIPVQRIVPTLEELQMRMMNAQPDPEQTDPATDNQSE